mmetsp:Transcript_116791/g.335194  ORF Transcript_116791/g.335194 Transcript_116791/m.335194 type:complete len:258 (+) Transcript_116791:1073-1846(+)
MSRIRACSVSVLVARKSECRLETADCTDFGEAAKDAERRSEAAACTDFGEAAKGSERGSEVGACTDFGEAAKGSERGSEVGACTDFGEPAQGSECRSETAASGVRIGCFNGELCGVDARHFSASSPHAFDATAGRSMSSCSSRTSESHQPRAESGASRQPRSWVTELLRLSGRAFCSAASSTSQVNQHSCGVLGASDQSTSEAVLFWLDDAPTRIVDAGAAWWTAVWSDMAIKLCSGDATDASGISLATGAWLDTLL